MRTHRTAAVLLFVAATLRAGDPPVPSGPVERVTIRLAQFDVVVRDAQGQLVGGLGKDDFTVLEDGSPLEIVAVDAWGFDAPSGNPVAPVAPAPAGEGAAAAAQGDRAPREEPERRSFVILFDALNGTSALRFTQAKRAAMGFVRQRLEPGDVAVIYTLDLAVRAQSGFSSDPEELARAIEKIPFMPGSTLADDVAESVLAYRSKAGYNAMDERLVGGANLEAERLDWARQHFYSSVQGLQDVFQALPGKRILILASAGFPLTAPGSLRRELGGFTPEFRELIRGLARAGVVAYTLDIGDDLAFSDPGKAIDWRIAVGKLGMDENVLDDLGLDAGMGSGSASQRRQVLGVLAAETGGRMLTQSDLTKAFQAIDEESSNFYRVSCRVAEREGDLRYRRIVVKVNQEGLKTSARRGRYGDIVPALRHEATAAAGKADDLTRFAPIGLRATASALPVGPDGRIPVAVVAEVLGPVAFAKEASGAATLELDFFAVARAAGEVVARHERRFAARVKPEGAAALGKAFRLEGRLDLPPGLYEIQTTVRVQNPPQFGSWTGPVAVHPQPATGGPRFAAAWLAADATMDAPLVLRVDPPAGVADPLVIGPGARVLPSTGRAISKGEGLLVVFWLRGLTVPDPTTPPKLRFDVKAKDIAGATVTPMVQLVAFESDGDQRWRGVARIETADLPPGTWSLDFEVTDLQGSETPATARLAFAIEGPATSSAP